MFSDEGSTTDDGRERLNGDLQPKEGSVLQLVQLRQCRGEVRVDIQAREEAANCNGHEHLRQGEGPKEPGSGGPTATDQRLATCNGAGRPTFTVCLNFAWERAEGLASEAWYPPLDTCKCVRLALRCPGEGGNSPYIHYSRRLRRRPAKRGGKNFRDACNVWVGAEGSPGIPFQLTHKPL